MTIYENFKNKDIDELTDWIAENCNFDTAPYWRWWDKNYCNKCKTEISADDEGNKKEYAYCELFNNCRYFKEMDNVPDNKETIKMWLESEC